MFCNVPSLKPVAVSLDIDDPAVMKQAVQYGRGNNGIVEEFLPVGKAKPGEIFEIAGVGKRNFFAHIAAKRN